MPTYHHTNINGFKDDYQKSENFAIRTNYFIDFKDDFKISEEWLKTIKKNQNFSSILKNLKIRTFDILAGLNFKNVSVFSGKTDSRLLVGLGNSHINETYLNFHHLYGVPYISGSSLKGVCRHYVVSNILNYENDDTLNLNCLDKLIELEFSENEIPNIELIREKTKYFNKSKNLTFYLTNEILEKAHNYFINGNSDSAKENWPALWFARKIFGSQSKRGEICFNDSFPENCTLESDIMNPHYGKYYESDDIPPADYLTPVPIKFLAIKKGAKFVFSLFGLGFSDEDQEILTQAELWLKDALVKYGIGAKTAVGYGYFEEKFKELNKEIEHIKEDVKINSLSETKKLLYHIEKLNFEKIEEGIKKINSDDSDSNELEDLSKVLYNVFVDQDNYDKIKDINQKDKFCALGLNLYLSEYLKKSYDDSGLEKLREVLYKNSKGKTKEKLKPKNIETIFKSKKVEEVYKKLQAQKTENNIKEAYKLLNEQKKDIEISDLKKLAKLIKDVIEKPSKGLKKFVKKHKEKYLKTVDKILGV